MSAWPPEEREIHARFRNASLPPSPFALRKGVTVLDSILFKASLEADIAAGPRGPRALLGAVQQDVRDALAASAAGR